jgi:hypothetical protein
VGLRCPKELDQAAADTRCEEHEQKHARARRPRTLHPARRRADRPRAVRDHRDGNGRRGRSRSSRAHWSPDGSFERRHGRPQRGCGPQPQRGCRLHGARADSTGVRLQAARRVRDAVPRGYRRHGMRRRRPRDGRRARPCRATAVLGVDERRPSGGRLGARGACGGGRGGDRLCDRGDPRRRFRHCGKGLLDTLGDVRDWVDRDWADRDWADRDWADRDRVDRDRADRDRVDRDRRWHRRNRDDRDRVDGSGNTRRRDCRDDVRDVAQGAEQRIVRQRVRGPRQCQDRDSKRSTCRPAAVHVAPPLSQLRILLSRTNDGSPFGTYVQEISLN